MTIVHRNLLWLHGEAKLLDRITKDKVLARFVVARPDPELVAVRRHEHSKLVSRLETLGHPPKEEGSW